MKTNSQKKPEFELFIMGKVQKRIKIAPQYLYFGIINTKEETIEPKSLEKIVKVNRVKGDDLIIEKIEPSADWIVAETETNQKGKNYTIMIKLDKNKLPKGKFKEKIKIYTKYNKTSEIADIIIEGKVI